MTLLVNVFLRLIVISKVTEILMRKQKHLPELTFSIQILYLDAQSFNFFPSCLRGFFYNWTVHSSGWVRLFK